MKFSELSEDTVIPQNASIEDLMKMLDGVHRGLLILKQLKDPHQGLRHALQIFKNYTRIKDALQELINKDNK